MSEASVPEWPWLRADAIVPKAYFDAFYRHQAVLERETERMGNRYRLAAAIEDKATEWLCKAEQLRERGTVRGNTAANCLDDCAAEMEALLNV